MHPIVILIALASAYLLRLVPLKPTACWTVRWHRALFSFLVPALLLLMTAIAVIFMGPEGQMIGLKADELSYRLMLIWLGGAIAIGAKLAFQGWRSVRKIRTYPQIYWQDRGPLRLLQSSQLFCAQIGFWQPELVISEGVLQRLSPEHLQAVLAHEQAHLYYRDTFWFFWLGWLRRLTFWLPNTELLWQELLVLRELRADRWARDRVDSLFLAEALLTVVSDAIAQPNHICAAFSPPISTNRLQERIDALLAEPDASRSSPWWTWSWIAIALIPWMVVPLHN